MGTRARRRWSRATSCGLAPFQDAGEEADGGRWRGPDDQRFVARAFGERAEQDMEGAPRHARGFIDHDEQVPSMLASMLGTCSSWSMKPRACRGAPSMSCSARSPKARATKR